jgi:hypothetical protein
MSAYQSPQFRIPNNNSSPRCTIIVWKILLLVLLVAGSNSAFSQLVPVNTIDISATYSPATGFIKSKNHEETKSKITQQTVNLGYGFLISSKTDSVTKKTTSWTGTINGSYTSLTSKNGEMGIIPKKLLYSDVGVVYYRTINARWALASMLSTGINSDLEDLGSHDLFINGGLLFIKTYSPRLSIGFGGGIYNALNTPMLLPGLMLVWQTTGKFKVNINLPSEVSVAYDATEKIELKMAFRPKNVYYNVKNAVDPKKSVLNYWELPVGLESKWKGKRVDFMISGGVMSLRSFQFGERGIKNMFKTYPSHTMAANVFVNAGISYRLKK